MVKNKFYTLILLSILALLNITNKSIAISNTAATIEKYPNYAKEFSGDDPWENFNRKVFLFNLKFNKYIIRPVNIVWASVMPQYGLDRVSNFYNNINYPIRLTSTLLQKDFKASKTETIRFFTNTTMGAVGLYDPAKNKFHIEPAQEDMGQALAHFRIKKGPYLVLPVVAQGNVRDIAGQIIDMPLSPTSYICWAPGAIASTSLSFLNTSTSIQPIYQMIESSYADPYTISKELTTADRYIKNMNLDRESVLYSIDPPQNTINISDTYKDKDSKSPLASDIQLANYNTQGPLVDSLRTLFFDSTNLNDSIWSDLSAWNKSFIKKIKTSSVEVEPTKPKYSFRYILQKEQTSPLAIIYPSIGEDIMSAESVVQAKILYDQGYSVIIQGSSFQKDFVKSMPDDYRPGFPAQDAYYLRIVTADIIKSLESKNNCQFKQKIIVGNSFGALTSLFVAQEEEANNTLGISKYIAINPPIDTFYALNQLDKYIQAWKKNPEDIRLRAAVTAEKIIKVAQEISDKNIKVKKESLPLNQDEAELAIGFVMKQKLANVVLTIENEPVSIKNELSDSINEMSFNDYLNKYILINQNKPVSTLTYESSLYSISNFLQKNNDYKIYHTLDDCFVNQTQLNWLKKQTKDKSILFSNGGHLGFLYRKEFFNQFLKDISLQSQ